MPVLEVVEGSLELLLTKCTEAEKQKARLIQCRTWDRKTLGWKFPCRPEIIKELSATLSVEIPAAAREMAAQIAQRESSVKAQKIEGWERATPVEPMPIKSITPFNHQILGHNIGMALPNFAILAEMGTGKTVMSLSIAGRRFQRKEINRVLVVCPSSVVPVWPKEIAEYLDVPAQVQCLDKTGDKARTTLESWKPDPEVLQFCVVNYEKTWRLEKELIAWNAELVICDESQRIKNPSAKQSKTIHKIGKSAKYRMILSGTPVTQNPTDLFSQYKFLDPSIFGSSYTAFKARYCIMGGYQRYQIIGYNHLEELVEKAHAPAYRVTKKEALDLPDTMDQELYCELEPAEMKLYRQMVKNSIMELENEKVIAAPNVLTRLLRLSQMTGGYIDHQKVSSAKMKLLKETLGDILGAGKSPVIFCRFLDEIKGIEKYLQEQKINYSLITGATPMKDRGQEVEKFQTDDNCRVFLAQIQTAGLGITLTKSDICIYYSLSYSYADYEQSASRVHRIGQTQKVTYLYLIVQNSIDEKVLKVLRKKGDVAKMVVDDWRSFIAN